MRCQSLHLHPIPLIMSHCFLGDCEMQVTLCQYLVFTTAWVKQEGWVQASVSSRGMLLTPLPVLICPYLTLAGENDMLLAVAVHIRGLPLSFRGHSWWESTQVLVFKNNLVWKMQKRVIVWLPSWVLLNSLHQSLWMHQLYRLTILSNPPSWL